MKAYSFEHEGKTYNRISRAKARRVHASGGEVIACACNLRPFGPWHPEASISHEVDFDKWVNWFEYYNCSYECGYYASFYA